MKMFVQALIALCLPMQDHVHTCFGKSYVGKTRSVCIVYVAKLAGNSASVTSEGFFLSYFLHPVMLSCFSVFKKYLVGREGGKRGRKKGEREEREYFNFGCHMFKYRYCSLPNTHTN